MKNLFKNLMLVAVAAMAFTACQNDNNEVNEVAKKTVISGVLSFDEETRSGFVGTESTDNGDGTTTTVYKSAWDGGETIKLFAENGLETTATVNTEGEFTAEFEGELPESFFMTVCSPAESWSSQYNSTIPAEQTPRANSVDPNAHLLQAQNVYVSNGTADAIVMGHQVAYGKMTVNAPEGFVIDNVVVNLKGTYYQNYERECTYTINADNVQNNVFWFTTETFENVTEFTVTAYDAEGIAVAKTVDVAAAGKTLAFNYGRVSTFSVSGLEAPVVPMFTSAYISASYYSDFYIYFEDSNGVLSNLKFNLGNMCDPDWILYTGEWKLGTYPGIYVHPDWKYSSYGDVALATGTVNIDIIDKKYHFEFINLADYNGNVLVDYATYVGSVEGLNVPDPRTQLATPNATATVDGKMVTISWDEVVGADSYKVTSDIYSCETNEKSVTFEAPEYSKTYNVSVVAVALDSNPTYKSSGACKLVISTDRDPDVVVPKFTTIKYVGTEDTYPMYGEYCHVFELTNSDNYKMNLYVGSYQSSSTHIEVGSYHYEGKENLGYASTQWGFQAKVWTIDGYLGSAYSNSSMIVEKSGDIYNINFTLIINDQTHFFECNAAIGGNEPEPDPEPDPEPEPEPEPGDSLEGYNTVSFVSVSKGSYIGREYNWIGDFVFDYMGAEITFTMCDYNGPMQAADKNIKEGVYTNNGNGANTNTKELYNISIAGMTGNSGSTVEVSKDGTDYVFKMIMKTVNGEYKFYYKGAL